MWVAMKQYISGGRHDGRDWPPIGVPIEVPDWEGEELVAHGQALWVAASKASASPPPPPVETVVSEPSSTSAGPQPPAPAEPEELPEPAPSDMKAVWVDYAVSQGASRQEAESLTKNQLQSAFGGRLLSWQMRTGARNG